MERIGVHTYTYTNDSREQITNKFTTQKTNTNTHASSLWQLLTQEQNPAQPLQAASTLRPRPKPAAGVDINLDAHGGPPVSGAAEGERADDAAPQRPQRRHPAPVVRRRRGGRRRRPLPPPQRRHG